MVLSHSSYSSSGVDPGGKIVKLKKDVWCNEEGVCAESKDDQLPAGWKKGKLMGRKGQEVTDAEWKSWNVVSLKAKTPKENKSK